VDDFDQQVDLVIRGADLETSTERQLQLASLLGRTNMPRFVHHPLLVKASGEKLSKAAGDAGIRTLRAAGVAAADVIGRAAAAVGLIDAARPVAATEVARLFTPAAVDRLIR
jgi:glutamyl/glutaminyl-tRNA synthetase